jgi:Predicted membrane protein
MMALTGVVFAMAFVMVQFSAIAYSPRLVMWFARDPKLFHSLGVFIATFLYSLSTLAWVDRAGSGKVPLFSVLVVVILLVLSMLLFARLVQSLNDLQINNVLKLIGDRGRAGIREMFRRLDENAAGGRRAQSRSSTRNGSGRSARP